MSTYVVSDKQSGQEVYRYVADAPIEWMFMSFDTHDHVLQPTVIDPDAPVALFGSRLLTPRQFRDLFTEEEKNAIDFFEENYRAMGLPIDVENRIRSGFKDYYASQEIDLDDPRVPMLLGVFAGFGCISFYRIDEVINGY